MSATFGAALAVVLASALAACGGHGGSSSSTGVPFQIVGSTQSYTGPAVATGITEGEGVTSAGLLQTGSSDSVTITTDANGNLQTLTINVNGQNVAPGITQAFAGASLITGPVTLTQLAAQAAAMTQTPTNTAVAIYQGSLAAGLSSSAYGMWIESAGGGSLNIGTLAFGVPATQMPTSGTATYSGNTIGFGSVGLTPFVLTGSVQLSANFTAQTVTVGIGNFTTQNISNGGTGTLPNLAGTGPISGTAYTVNLTSSASFSGSTNGEFFGVGAPEVGGAWYATNFNGTYAFGSYGLKK